MVSTKTGVIDGLGFKNYKMSVCMKAVVERSLLE